MEIHRVRKKGATLFLVAPFFRTRCIYNDYWTTKFSPYWSMWKLHKLIMVLRSLLCRRPSVCLSSVTFVHPTQPV